METNLTCITTTYCFQGLCCFIYYHHLKLPVEKLTTPCPVASTENNLNPHSVYVMSIFIITYLCIVDNSWHHCSFSFSISIGKIWIRQFHTEHVYRTHSFLNSLTSSYIFRLSAPLGFFPLSPLLQSDAAERCYSNPHCWRGETLGKIIWGAMPERGW